MSQSRLHIEVAFALPEKQRVIPLLVEPGTTIAQAIERSRIADCFENLVVDPDSVGVFGRRLPPDHVLSDGDRVEIYRPLIADPKDSRRCRADAVEG